MRALRIWLGIAALVLLAACSVPQVSKDQLDKAKAAAYGLESSYVIVLRTATVWAEQPRCKPAGAPPPLCSTAIGVISMDKMRTQARSTLDRLNVVLADANSSPDAISVAISTAQQAMGLYQEITNQYKGG